MTSILKPTTARVQAMMAAREARLNPVGGPQHRLAWTLVEEGLLFWQDGTQLRVTDEGQRWLAEHEPARKT